MSHIISSILNATMSSQCSMAESGAAPLNPLETLLAPALVLGGVALTGVVVAKNFCRKVTTTLETRMTQLVQDCQDVTPQIASKKIHAFVDENWAAIISGNPCLDTKKNRRALYEKLFKVLITEQPSDVKLEICKNVVGNYKTSNERAMTRIQSDLATPDFRALFRIEEGATIKQISRLGEETHHKGDVPFEVEFSDGAKIVYKPRSMCSEKAICAHEGSYFAKLQEGGRDLGTYRILDRGEYGYSEFLENRQEENTYETLDGMREYAGRLATLDLFANEIKLTDLHNGNIAVSDKRVFAIDTEVVMGPGIREVPFDTMVLRWGQAVPSWHPEPGTINKVYWRTDEGRVVNFERADGMFFREMIEEEVTHCPPIRPEEREIADKCKAVLAEQKHRIVMIATETLSDFIKRTPNADTREKFLGHLEERMAMHGCRLDKSQEGAIWEKFKEDLLNNDVPVFYFHPASNTVSYDGLIIGEKISSSSSAGSKKV